jgi:hypothetical protein
MRGLRIISGINTVLAIACMVKSMIKFFEAEHLATLLSEIKQRREENAFLGLREKSHQETIAEYEQEQLSNFIPTHKDNVA